ncbi:MAG: arsenate reductase ArsC [Alphaproteobacteria bacterium]|nr:arsenate reductase ArsC [Alphaproteobacteria bacterium]
MQKNILFLCTGNSARSIMAEAYMNHIGGDRWRAFSAGSRPTGAPNPLAITTLLAHGIDPGAPSSKSWDEFSGDGAPLMDVVVTVCDSAAAEACPVWPTRPDRTPEKIHWPFPDPASVDGEENKKRLAFESVFASIRQRIDLFVEGRR